MFLFHCTQVGFEGRVFCHAWVLSDLNFFGLINVLQGVDFCEQIIKKRQKHKTVYGNSGLCEQDIMA